MQMSRPGSCKVLFLYFNVAEIKFFGPELKLTCGSEKPLFAVRFEAGPWQAQATTFPLFMPNSEWRRRVFISPVPGAGGGHCAHTQFATISPKFSGSYGRERLFSHLRPLFLPHLRISH